MVLLNFQNNFFFLNIKLVAHTHIHCVRGKADIRHIRYRAIPEKNKHNRGVEDMEFPGLF